MTICTMLPLRVPVANGQYSAGTWSAVSGSQKLALDLNTLSTVPVGAKTAIFEVNTNSTGARFGIQSTGDTDFYVSETASTGRQSFIFFCPINGAQTVDVFLTSTANGTINLLGYMDHLTHITPVDLAAGITTATTTTIDLSIGDIVPAGAASGAVLITLDKLAKVAGNSADLASMIKPAANVTRAQLIVPLDANRRFYVQSYATFAGASALRVTGWCAAGAYVPETTYTTEDVTADSTFHQFVKTSSGVFDHYRIGNGTTTASGSSALLRGLRPSNDTSYTTAIDADTNTNNPYAFVKVDANGKADGFAAVANVHYERHGTFVGDTTAAAISTIDTFVAGATATVVFNKSVLSVTRLRVASVFDNHFIDITSFSGSGTTWTFTVPQLTNSTDGIRLGVVTITPTTNQGTGADFTSKTYSKTNYSSVNIEDVLAGNVCEGDSPALLTADQIAYDSTTGGSVDVHGIYYDPPPVFIGTQTMWHYASDFKWYSFTITTEEGVPSEPSGGTSITRAITRAISNSITTLH